MYSDTPECCGPLDETFRHEAPIFAHLALQWARAGRTVPGWSDEEWRHLTAPPAPSHHHRPGATTGQARATGGHLPSGRGGDSTQQRITEHA
ncbi:hypothetical protein GCM10009665_58740 [Kitasatospora nipponensis]|uniref:Uncharacterized protein n=1 Tax=Kitasatospora nipponensis TaxID=258049 RepID=A0ABN1WUF0_9ACTN